MSKLRDIRVLTTAAMLVAISIVLGFFKIPITQLIEIRFSFLANAMAGALFGPFVGGLVGALSDLGGYLIKPTGPYFPGFTLTAAVGGVIAGLTLYGHKPSLIRCFFCEFLRMIIANILLNGIFLSMLYGRGFVAVVTSRILKQLVMLPVQTLMLFAAMQLLVHFKRESLVGGSRI